MIIAAVAALDSDVKDCLYGSRFDDGLGRGDVDPLIVSDTLDFSDKLALLADLKTRIGEQKIDLSIKRGEELEDDAFLQSIRFRQHGPPTEDRTLIIAEIKGNTHD